MSVASRCRRAAGLVPLVALLLLSMTAPPTLTGHWTLDADRSTPVDPWRDLSLRLDVTDSTATIVRSWTYRRLAHADSVTVPLDGSPHPSTVTWWADSRHLAAHVQPGDTKTVRAWTDDGGTTLRVEQHLTLHTSQGTAPVRVYTEYRLAPDGDRLDVLELRSSRPAPLHYVFRRAEPSS